MSLGTGFATGLALLSTPAVAQTPAQAASWSLTKSGVGAPVARLEYGAGPVRAIELVCNGPRIAIGLQLSGVAREPTMAIAFQGNAGTPIAFSALRIGKGSLYAAVLPDARLADGLTGGWTRATVSAAGTPLALPLKEARPIVRKALAQCLARARTAAI